VAGRDSYQQFYEHTIKVHDQTPLTNHMGLRVLIAHKLGSGPQSGRAMFVKDDKLVDPFEVWKRMRNERYAHYRLVAYAIVAACFAFFVVARGAYARSGSSSAWRRCSSSCSPSSLVITTRS
jgi:hypothetical protein